MTASSGIQKDVGTEPATGRQELISWWLPEILKDAHLAVVGCGAIGNEVLKNLALIRVGHLYTFDFDTISKSNLSRTVLFEPTDVGRSKVEVAVERLKRLSPETTVYGQHVDVVWELGGGFLRQMDVVMTCLDNLEARLAVWKHCYQFNIPLLDGTILELDGRVQHHRTGVGACFDCSISTAQRPQLRHRYSCLNVMATVVDGAPTPTVQTTSAFVAAVMCQEAVKILHGKDSIPSGHTMSWRGEISEMNVLRMPRRTGCLTCGKPPARIVDLPLTPENTLDDLLRYIGRQWQVSLPSSFILRYYCKVHDYTKDVYRPDFRCYDRDLVCPHGNCGGPVSLHEVQVVGSSSRDLLSVTLRDLGMVPLGTFFGSDGGDVALFVLSGAASGTV